VLAAGADATEWLRQYTQKDEADAYEFLRGKGMEVALDVDVASFREACADVIPKFPDLFPPDLVKLARSAPG
jgi:TRAP-type transport system periplasmic protein